MEASLQEILDAREARVSRQQALLKQYGKPLVCFTMNIPGPEKRNRDVDMGFYVGNRLLQEALGDRVLFREERLQNAGCEAFYVVDLPAKELKSITVDLEATDPMGRLFDMDVLDTDGIKLDRGHLDLPARKCLLCDQDAAICASRRAHPLEELTDRTGFLLYLTARQYLAEYIAVQAYLALNREVSATPKPGLVDGDNRGAHSDMDIRHFFASANALRPYFCRFAEAGYLSRDGSPKETFAQIRGIGVEAESAMLRATHGANTHKGAIFSLGILCAAAGRLSPMDWQPERLLKECAAIAEGVVKADFAGITIKNARTVGEQLYAQYGITGVRGQAEHGFPAVRDVGLPILRQGLGKGLSINDAGCVALLHLIAATEDTNLIHRGDRQTQLRLQADMQKLLADDPFPSMDTIRRLDNAYTEQNLSPGGSADLLAFTYFLHFLTQ